MFIDFRDEVRWGEEGALRPGSLLSTVNLMTFRCQYNQGRTENVGQVWKSCGWNLGRAFSLH